MRRKRLRKFIEKRALLFILVLCLLSAAGMYGMYRMEIQKAENTDFDVTNDLADLNEPVEEESPIVVNGKAKSEQGESADADAVAGADGAVTNAGADSVVTNIGADALAKAGSDATSKADSETIAATGQDPEALEEGTPAIGGAATLHFSAENKIQWPVKGNIIMDYSPDKTIYFATLDQYRTNPAIFIQASTGTQVASCANGIVDSVKSDDELGTTLTLNLGNGYQAVYGQLENVQVKKGAYVSVGDNIANVSVPSRYFGVEGSHLYFQMLKDGEPVNPRAFLE